METKKKSTKNKTNKTQKSKISKPNQEEKTQNEQKNNENQVKNNKNHNFYVKHVWYIDALLFIIGTLGLGGLATLLGGNMFNFKDYIMPPGTVPKIVFPIAWSIIYIAIGTSTFLMWRDKEIKSTDRKINLILYFVHMTFNVIWPLLFFRLNLPIFAVICLLIAVITACVVMTRYYMANLPAGIIFSIYATWLLYALYLNLGIVLLNLI